MEENFHEMSKELSELRMRETTMKEKF